MLVSAKYHKRWENLLNLKVKRRTSAGFCEMLFVLLVAELDSKAFVFVHGGKSLLIL